MGSEKVRRLDGALLVGRGVLPLRDPIFTRPQAQVVTPQSDPSEIPTSPRASDWAVRIDCEENQSNLTGMRWDRFWITYRANGPNQSPLSLMIYPDQRPCHPPITHRRGEPDNR
jgi:hypothetical protein